MDCQPSFHTTGDDPSKVASEGPSILRSEDRGKANSVSPATQGNSCVGLF